MRHTILLADDSPTIQRLVNQTFADTRFDIVAVNNGDAAIRKFDEIEPDVVLADIYMPGKNGYEVCAHIKAHPSLSATPVILLVGAFDAFDEATATQAGASANITKPFEPRALIDLVISALPESPRARKTATNDVVTVTEQQPIPDKPVAPERPVEKAAEQQVESPPAIAVQPVSENAGAVVPAAPAIETADLLGLERLFPPEVTRLSEDEIEKIAERVLRKLSTQAVENIAWDVVPDIAAKVLRDELKKTNS